MVIEAARIYVHERSGMNTGQLSLKDKDIKSYVSKYDSFVEW